jgi:hypothetical protein
MITITLRYKLTPEDCKSAYNRFSLGVNNRLDYLAITVLIVIGILGFSYIMNGLTYFFQALHIVLTGVFVYIFLSLVYFHYYTALFQSQRFSQQQKTLQTEYETVISPEMIEIISEYGSMRMRLSAFSSYSVSKNMIVLYEFSPYWWAIPQFYIFPRRFFLSEGHFKTFLSYLKANLERNLLLQSLD